MALELVKENIGCEQLLGENTVDTVVKNEFVIPDTNPDVFEILMLDAKPSIESKEIMQDKIYVEGKVEYNLLYLAKEEDKDTVCNVTYVGKFSNYIDVSGSENKINCNLESYLEHMDCNILNERKIAVEGIIKIKADIYMNYDFQIVKDIIGADNMQMQKVPSKVDKILGTASGDMIARCHMQIPMEKPQIGTIIKCDVNIHKKDVKLLENKVFIEAHAHVFVLYKGKDTRELFPLEDDIAMTKEIEYSGIYSGLDSFSDFRVDSLQYDIKEDDLGENRIIDLEALVQVNTKLMEKEDIDMIEDAYSPEMMLDMTKKTYNLNMTHGHGNTDIVVKGNIEIPEEQPKPEEILLCTGNINVTDKKLVEDKILIEGLINVKVLYRTADENKYIYCVEDEIPFNCNLDIEGTKIDMQCIVKVSLESIEGNSVANNVAIKAVVNVYGRVNYIQQKEFLVDLIQSEEAIPVKKASITIYVIQKGDNLWKVAKKYYTTIEDLMKINELQDENLIKPGEKLLIPGKAII